MSKEDPTLASFHALVTGIVQGVYFRAFVESRARALGLTGYVRNVTQSGAVEVEAEGDKTRLEQLIGHLRQGPRAAKVDKVDVHWGTYSGRFSGFDITR
ncbi:MAG: acylphosphatase [Dehalococcoidia bacterium]|nr:acylphosphatase [Dehalococcoidia bacterium]